MTKSIEGIVPVMLTPFLADGNVDYAGLENLTEWYLANGADALFAVCQSSEMQLLTLGERTEIARFVVGVVGPRVPVIASGHIADDAHDQADELNAIAETGVDAVVLVTNRLDPRNEGTHVFCSNLDDLLQKLPADMPLGLYECPAPYRRLISDDELRFCRDSSRFIVLKDVSCELETVKTRANIVKDSRLNIINANAAIAFEAMKSGSKGFAGVFTNFHPDLYSWLWQNRDSRNPIIAELANFLALAACSECMGYPGLAKLYHKNLGTIQSEFSRVIDYDLREKHWAIDAILSHIHNGSVDFRNKIGAVRYEKQSWSSEHSS